MEKNLLILGASSDLATALLPRICKEFSVVFAHYHRNAQGLKALESSLTCDLRLMQADFTSEEETRSLMNEVAASGMPITHILHCTSVKATHQRFKKLQWEDFVRMLDTQLRSLYYAANTFVPDMAKRQYGKVVTIVTSGTCGTPPTYMSAYITAKYAQLGFIRALAAEYSAKNVQINAVSPSMIETKFLKDMSHLTVEKTASEHPLGRNATVEDVIPAIEFLLSDQSGFITGQNLLVSGGSVI